MSLLTEDNQYILEDNLYQEGASIRVTNDSEDLDEDYYSDCEDECGSTTILPEFDNARNRQSFIIGPYDPRRKYLSVGPGLNIQAKCMNPRCPQAFGKKVWIHKKYGIFRVDQLKFELQCPVCQVDIDYNSFHNIGFTRTRVVLNGVKIKENIIERVINYREQETVGKFLTYLDRPECQVKWGFLTIEALPL